MREKTLKEMKQREKYFGDFQGKTQNELKVIKDEVNSEMENRFISQNEIADNISNFLKTVQDILKIVGW